MSLAMRIRRLENAVPILKEKLDAINSTRLENGGFTSTGGNDTLGRVEALEDAVEMLLIVQVHLLNPILSSLLPPHRSPSDLIFQTLCSVYV